MVEKPESGGLMVSIKLMVSMAASMVVIMGSFLGACGWVIGLYNGLDKRLTIVEASNARMSDDIREIKMMVSQMLTNRVDSRPDMQRWSK